MKRHILALILVCISGQVSAIDIPEWLQPFIYEDVKPWQLSHARQSVELYDCGLEKEDSWFCSDSVYYYGVNVEGKLQVIKGALSRLDMVAPFSSDAYSGLILNLRKDGFELSWLSVEGVEYDVIQKMKSESHSKVNREVVLLLNRGKLSSPRRLLWRKSTSGKESWAELISDGKVIKIRFSAGVSS